MVSWDGLNIDQWEMKMFNIMYVEGHKLISNNLALGNTASEKSSVIFNCTSLYKLRNPSGGINFDPRCLTCTILLTTR
jgi:hypothetical protein